MIGQRRKLAAILAADIAGYSALMAADDEGTVAALKACQEAILPEVPTHSGRIIDIAGDGILAVFDSAVAAVSCAISIQNILSDRSRKQDSSIILKLRIGIHLGDVIDDGERVFGDGVNIAARLESISAPGSLCISASVYEAIAGRISASFMDIGERELKNIPRSIRVFAWKRDDTDESLLQINPLKQSIYASPEKATLAVLPFRYVGGDMTEDYFAEGITEDIITILSRVKWFFVISRSTSFQFKQKMYESHEIGRMLGVRYILEGTIRRSGSRLRITGELLEADSGKQIWAERYDGNIEDVFDLQDRVASSVAAAIEPRLQNAEITRALRSATSSLDAYDLYLRALPPLYRLSAEGYAEAHNLLDQAVSVDPNFAQAWAALADCVGRQATFGWMPLAEGRQLSIDAALRAVAADPENPFALSISAWALACFAGRFEEASENAQRALKTLPSSAQVRTDCGWAYVKMGESEMALEHLYAARALNPMDQRGWTTLYAIAEALLFGRRFEEAAVAAQRGIDARISHVPLMTKTVALVNLGRLDEAVAAGRELVRVNPAATISRYVRNPLRHAWMVDMVVNGLRSAGVPE